MIGKDIGLTLHGNSIIKNGDFAMDSDLDRAWANRILRASPGAWAFDGELGVGLQDFAGFPNTQETGHLIEDAVINGLRKVGINAQCVVYPISFDAVAIQVTLFTVDGPRQLGFQFRYAEAKIEYIDSEVQDTIFVNRETTNKYDRRAKN